MPDTKFMLAFIEPTERGDYHDALPFDPNEKFDSEAIQVQIKKRVDTWLAIVNTPPVEEPAPEPEYEVTCEDGVILNV